MNSPTYFEDLDALADLIREGRVHDNPQDLHPHILEICTRHGTRAALQARLADPHTSSHTLMELRAFIRAHRLPDSPHELLIPIGDPLHTRALLAAHLQLLSQNPTTPAPTQPIRPPNTHHTHRRTIIHLFSTPTSFKS